jgi:hypothetical protein
MASDVRAELPSAITELSVISSTLQEKGGIVASVSLESVESEDSFT